MMVVTQRGNSLLDRIVDFIIPPNIVDFLNQTLYRNSFIIFNYWTFVHFLVGIIFYILKPQEITLTRWFVWWIIVNISFEILEYILGLGGNPLFVEEALDIIWDILWSLLGFVLISGILFLTKRLYNKK